jgi:hypothetical protein
MFEIEMERASSEFKRCWLAAARHLDAQGQGSLSWLRDDCNPPFLEHLSFRIGNQLFFIRVEDADGRLEEPGNRDGLQAVAKGCGGHGCLMPMRNRAGVWTPDRPGWGIVEAKSGKLVDPVTLVSDELIEMTAWELHDLAVLIVRNHLEQAGRKLMTWTSHPSINPAIWFVGDSGPEWVVVGVARYPQREIKPPENWQQIAASVAHTGNVGHFAPVVVANADDAFDPSGSIPVTPLWRGHRMRVWFNGLVPGAA